VIEPGPESLEEKLDELGTCAVARLTSLAVHEARALLAEQIDYSIKHAIFRCPDGVALLAYAGQGRINSLDLSDWLRETLRGETRTLDQSVTDFRVAPASLLNALTFSITPIHSSRSNIAGSIESARCAGIHVATNPSNP
jgi:hypothetical protein